LGGALKSFRKAMDSDDRNDEEHRDAKRLEDGKPDAEFAEQKDKSQSG
jgi:Sec-independent protein translocase protein TatA